MRRLGLVLLVVLVTTVVLAQPAGATYPGKKGVIAYTDSTTQIATVKADGTGVRVLTSLSGAAWPQFSANGKQIVFSGFSGAQYDIYKMRQDGSRLKQLTNSASSDFAPSFSPDGKQVVWSQGAPGPIWVMDSDGSGAHQISAGPGWFPRYSPDGKKIVYENAADIEIHVMRAGGSGDRAITSDPAHDEDPDWSPDGKKIAFRSNRTGAWQIWVMNADGSHPVQVPSTDVAGGPVFSPNGKKLACVDTTGNLFLVKLDGTGYRVVVPGPVGAIGVGWQALPKKR